MRRREFVGACAGAALVNATRGSRAAEREVSAEAEGQIPPFRLSVMLWTVHKELPFEQRLERVAQAGYKAVELVNEYKSWTKEEFARTRRKKQELGITIDATSGISHSLCDPAQRDSLLEEIRAKMAVLEELECGKLILLSGNKVAGMSSAVMHASCVEGLKRAATIAAEKNVDLLLENIDPLENPKYFLTSGAEGFEITREAGHPRVKFLYDFFHEQIAEGNLISKLEKNIELVGLVHVADVPGRHEPGTGEVNYANIFRKLGQLGYNGYVAMEFMAKGETVAALRAAREMALEFGSAAAVSRG